jgi:hypothetical protein
METQESDSWSLDARVVCSELIGTGGGWGDEKGNEWVGDDLKHGISSRGEESQGCHLRLLYPQLYHLPRSKITQSSDPVPGLRFKDSLLFIFDFLCSP